VTNFVTGQEICGISTQGTEGELAQGRSREAEEDIWGSWCNCQARLISTSHSFMDMGVLMKVFLKENIWCDSGKTEKAIEYVDK
jgi:hypothetical protein